jgi:hypothetical protein
MTNGDSRRGSNAVATTCDFRDFQDSASVNWGLAYPYVSSEVWTSRVRIWLTGAAPEWWYQIKPRLFELVELEANWDPRGSQEVSLDDLEEALEFMGRVMRSDTVAPWIGPLASGGIELIWHVGNIEVEAVFDSARGERELLVCVGDNEAEAPIDQAETLFATVVDRLEANDPVAA